MADNPPTEKELLSRLKRATEEELPPAPGFSAAEEQAFTGQRIPDGFDPPQQGAGDSGGGGGGNESTSAAPESGGEALRSTISEQNDTLKDILAELRDFKDEALSIFRGEG